VLDTDWGRSLRLEVEAASTDPWSAADRLLGRVAERLRHDV